MQESNVTPFPFDGVELGAEPSVSIELITPIAAAHILENHNPRNRKLNEINVRNLANEMLAGEWKFNGDTISFDTKGDLFDGQHRLAAIVKSSIQQKVIVVHNIDFDSAAGTKDAGKNRSPADFLTIMLGVERNIAPTVVGACQKLARWEQTQGQAVITGAANNMSTRKVGDYFERNRDPIEYAIAWMDEMKPKDLLLNRAEVLFVSTLILSMDTDQGETYLNQALRGYELTAGTLTQIVNEQLSDWKSHEQRTKEKKYTAAQRILTVLRGWDYYRRGKNIRTRETLVWKEGKDYPAIPFGSHTL